jgi:hypothetical protein
MSYVFPASLALIFIAILWMPASAVCLFLRGMGVPRPFAGLGLVWVAQLLLTGGLIYVIYQAGVTNPAAYGFAILVASSALGAALLWWRRSRTS